MTYKNKITTLSNKKLAHSKNGMLYQGRGLISDTGNALVDADRIIKISPIEQRGYIHPTNLILTKPPTALPTPRVSRGGSLLNTLDFSKMASKKGEGKKNIKFII